MKNKKAMHLITILCAILNGYVTGNKHTKAMTRAHLALILYRYAGSPSYGSNITTYFNDCDDLSATFKQAIYWARDKGYIKGYNGKIYDPEGDVKRITTTVVLYRYSHPEQN